MLSLIEPGCDLLSACGILANGHVRIGWPLNVCVRPAACTCAYAVDHVKFKTTKIDSQGILVNYTKTLHKQKFPAIL